MTEQNPDAAFLAAGLRHFPDAHATVSAFRRIVAEKVQAVLAASDASVWRPRDIKPTRSESNGLWVGAGGKMEMTALAGKQLPIDVGVWWDASHFKERIAAVVAVYDATQNLGCPLEAPLAEGVQLVSPGGRHYFTVGLSDPKTDLEHALTRVVDAAVSSVRDAVTRIQGAPAAPNP